MSPLWTVLIGTSMLGAVAGIVGSFAVLRRRALVGDLLAHTALPGICVAFLLSGGRHFSSLMVGALVSGLAGVTLMTLACRWTRIKEDAALGIVLSTFFGAGTAISSVMQRNPDIGGKAGIERYIFGQAAGMIRQDLWLIAGVSLVSLVITVLLFKEFKAISFDSAFAQVQGWPTGLLDLTMMGLLAVVTVVGLPAVGVVLMAAMLITPAAAARLWTNRLSIMLPVAGVFGGAAAVLGTLLSAGKAKQFLGFDPLAFGPDQGSLPTGPLIVLAGTTLFLVSLFFAPDRGLLSRAWSAFRLRRRVADENLLRTLYELSEPFLPELPQIGLADLLRERAWSRLRAGRLLRRCEARGLVGLSTSGVRLTDRGLAQAAELARRHRLWELFLIRGANIAADHVDRDADAIEHQLPAEVIKQLEAEMAAAELPVSPHELPEASLPRDRHE